MHIIKSLKYLFKGMVGIFGGSNSLRVKLLLVVDIIRLFFLFIRISISSPRTEYCFYSSAFQFKCYFSSFQSFFFVFNEVFCIQTYPVKKNLKNFYDVGANIGLTILFYHIYNPDLQIHAFEPNPDFFNLLEKNIKVNNIKNCILHQLAISNTIGEQRFYSIKDSVQNLDSSLYLNLELPCITYTVQCDRITSFIKEPISLIKIDVEGAEYDIFEDLLSKENKAKLNFINEIILEAHHINAEQKEKFDLLSKKITNLGKVEVSDFSKTTTMVHYEKNSHNHTLL